MAIESVSVGAQILAFPDRRRQTMRELIEAWFCLLERRDPRNAEDLAMYAGVMPDWDEALTRAPEMLARMRADLAARGLGLSRALP